MSPGSVSSVTNYNVGQVNQVTSVVKLPPIRLPTLEGKYEQWVPFHDTFKSHIHADTTSSDTQKLFYLKSCLKNEAAGILSSIEISDANYTIAWNLLKDRYEHKRLIVQNHIKLLFEIQPMAKESLHFLRKLQDDVKMNIRALKALGQPTEHWDSLLLYLISSKLDSISKREWERLIIEHDYKTLDNMYDFLTQRCHLLEAMQNDKGKDQSLRERDSFKGKPPFKSSSQGVRSLFAGNDETRPSFSCYLCKGAHLLYKCKKFLDLTVKNREKEAKRLNLCLNYLRANHMTQDCSSSNCRKCNKRHNSLLHIEITERAVTKNNSENQEGIGASSVSTVVNCQAVNASEVLLSTAVVNIVDKSNNIHECRVLLDSGSQCNFISADMCKFLNLDVTNLKIPVVGMNQSVTNTSFVTEAKIKSRFTNFQVNVPLVVIDKITGNLPVNKVIKCNINIPKNIILRDANFSEPRQVDLLLGATIFWDLLCVGQIRLNKNQPVIQKTKFGWIISGSVPMPGKQEKSEADSILCNLSTSSLQDQIERFLKIEDCYNESKIMSTEELECEEHFTRNTVRRNDGYFEVKLSIKEEIIEKIGNSYDIAEKRFLQLKGRLRKNSNLKERYSEFMQEYLDMGHMSKVNGQEHESCEQKEYYMPHHGVIKEESETTKLK